LDVGLTVGLSGEFCKEGGKLRLRHFPMGKDTASSHPREPREAKGGKGPRVRCPLKGEERDQSLFLYMGDHLL